MDWFLGVDIGTSSIKAVLYDPDFNEYDRSTVPIDDCFDSQLQLDLNKLWKKLEELLRSLTSKLKGERVFTGVVTFCPCLVIFNKNEEPLVPGITYQSLVLPHDFSLIDNIREFIDITRNYPHRSSTSVISLLAIRRYHPEWFNKIYKIGHLGTFILHKITGSFVIDKTNAAFTGLYDISKGTWSVKLLEEFQIDSSVLPTLLDSHAIAGNILPKIASSLGISRSSTFIVGSADTPASAFGLGLEKRNDVFLTSGTTTVFSSIKNNADELTPQFLNRPYVIPRKYISHGVLSHTGSFIKWCKAHIKDFEKDLQETWDNVTIRKIAIESIELFCFPSLGPERGPFWDTKIRGGFLNLTHKIHTEHLIYVTYEAIAFGVRYMYELMTGKIRDYLIVVGGAAQNRIFTIILASCLKIPVLPIVNPYLTAFGGALLAAEGCQKLNSEDRGMIIGKMITTSKVNVVTPDSALSKILDDKYNKFKFWIHYQ